MLCLPVEKGLETKELECLGILLTLGGNFVVLPGYIIFPCYFRINF